MDMETLARLIAEKVMEELRAVPAAVNTGSRALVFAERSEETERSLRELLGQHCAIDYYHKAFTPAGYDRYIIPHLCCPNMAALAVGQTTSAMTRAVLQLLLEGRTIEVMHFEYQQYKTTAPDSLYRLYQGYADKLRAYGMVAITPHGNSYFRVREQLVTEKMIREIAAEGYAGVTVPADAIVTDLAEESALALDFTLQRAPKEG